MVAAERIKPYAIMAPLVLKALPECGSPPMGAVEIADAIVYGSRSTVRMLLANMVRLGLAIAEEVPARHGGFKKVYTRGPALVPDNFESAKLVYGDGET
jgi:predicted transcriptional regulator